MFKKKKRKKKKTSHVRRHLNSCAEDIFKEDLLTGCLRWSVQGRKLGRRSGSFPSLTDVPHTHCFLFGVWVHLSGQMKTGEQQTLDLLAWHVKIHSVNVSKSHVIHCR